MSTIKQPIFIVGAPRCGKKMTSQVLGSHPDVYAYEFEMNFLWRYGNVAYPHDEFSEGLLTDQIKAYIRNRFEKDLIKSGKKRIVDRTDHNVPRLHYVRKVFPDAIILFVVRDPRPSVLSATKRRVEKVGWSPYFQKAKTIPVRDVIYYSFHYGLDVLKTKLLKNYYKKLWGIRTPRLLQQDREMSLLEQCAFQWDEAVRYGIRFQRELPKEVIKLVRYEDMVSDPIRSFKDIFEFCKIDWHPSVEMFINKKIFSRSLNQWKQELSSEQLSVIQGVTGETMQRLGCYNL